MKEISKRDEDACKEELLQQAQHQFSKEAEKPTHHYYK